MQKRVYIIHGWEGKPESNWFPWLKAELKKKGFESFVPQMPNADFPQMKEWLAYIQKLVGEPDEDCIFVGHSLGVIAILRYLEALPAGKKVGGAVLVAGFSNPIGIAELENFFETPLDYKKVKESVKKIIAVNSDNDHYVPLEQGNILQDKLGAKLIIIPNGRHLNEGDGHFRFPLVLEEIMTLAA